MFTVIISEKKHLDAIERNRLFFKPFLDSCPDKITFCEWNPNGNDFYECVPSLISTVGRHKLWRAVLITEDSLTLNRNPFDYIPFETFSELSEKYKLTNPCDETADDVPGTSSADADEDTEAEYFENWKSECEEKSKEFLRKKSELIYEKALDYPLQKLATCLCYVSEEITEVKTQYKTDIEDYAHKALNSRSYAQCISETERRHYLEEDREKKLLRKRCVDKMLPGNGMDRTVGSMGIVLPSEMVCFAIRTTETGFFKEDSYWKNYTGFEYSSFANRNMYFDRMRFIVSDVVPKTHQEYRCDYIRFLYNVMLFSLNEVPTGVILPRKLYCLESENDEKSLKDLVSSYICKIDNSIELVDAQIDKIKRDAPKEMTDNNAELKFCTRSNVSVNFDKDFKSDALYADRKEFGYFSDTPKDCFSEWNRQFSQSENTLEKMVKQPRRALKKAVDRLEFECEVDYNQIRALNSFQLDDVRDFTQNSEEEMMSVKVTNLFDITKYKENLEAESKKVKSVLERRMKRKTTVALGAVCIGMFVFAFLPLIFTNRLNVAYLSTALMMGGLSAAFLAVGLAITVWFLRRPLMKAISDYNQTAKSIENEQRDTMRNYSKYLSAVCNVRRGYKVLNFSENDLDEYDRGIRVRKKHKNDMEKTRAYVLEDYGDFYVPCSVMQKIETPPYEYDFGREKEEFDYSPPYLSEEAIRIEYLEKGNSVTVPSDFVKKVTIRLEECYDE